MATSDGRPSARTDGDKGTDARSRLRSRGSSGSFSGHLEPPPASRGDRPDFLAHVASQPSQAGMRPPTGRERRERHQRGRALRTVAIVAGVVAGIVAALALAALVAYLVLRDSTVFQIESIEVEATDHVSLDDIQNLVQVEEGATLLNVDTDAITESLMQDSWVASVSYEYVWPHTLRVTIVEQEVSALVVMSSGSIAWYLGDAGIWIEPVKLVPTGDQTVDDAGLAIALEEGVVLITDVPASVSPSAGEEATDDVLEAVALFREGFSTSFSAQVVCYYAPSTDSISCLLSNGVEVLLGSASDIAEKEAIATEILEEYEGLVTYINVRNPTSTGTSFRLIDSDSVTAGSGATVTTTSDDDTDSDDS